MTSPRDPLKTKLKGELEFLGAKSSVDANKHKTTPSKVVSSVLVLVWTNKNETNPNPATSAGKLVHAR